MADATLTFKAFKAPLGSDEMADRLELIAKQIREGYTSGDAHGAGWWSVEGLEEDSSDLEDEDDES